MGKLDDLTGRRFGRWTVLGRGTTKHRGAEGTKLAWVVRCDCGFTAERWGTDLKQGKTCSCGCLRSDLNRDRMLYRHELIRKEKHERIDQPTRQALRAPARA